jgi:hypothetical protein
MAFHFSVLGYGFSLDVWRFCCVSDVFIRFAFCVAARYKPVFRWRSEGYPQWQN